MNDTDIVQTAYAAALTRLFAVFVDGLVAADGDTEQQARAATAFKSGLAMARTARDQALQMVRQA